MSLSSSNALTAFFLVTLVFGLFSLAAILRIRSSIKILRSGTTGRGHRGYKTVDIIFSAIFLAASIAFYGVFIANFGR